MTATMNKLAMMRAVFYSDPCDLDAAGPLADLLEENNEEPYLVAGLRFCVTHSTWPEMVGRSVIHGGSYRIVGPVADPEAQAVLCLLGILHPEKFDSVKNIVSTLGIVLLALRYGNR